MDDEARQLVCPFCHLLLVRTAPTSCPPAYASGRLGSRAGRECTGRDFAKAWLLPPRRPPGAPPTWGRSSSIFQVCRFFLLGPACAFDVLASSASSSHGYMQRRGRPLLRIRRSQSLHSRHAPRPLVLYRARNTTDVRRQAVSCIVHKPAHGRHSLSVSGAPRPLAEQAIAAGGRRNARAAATAQAAVLLHRGRLAALQRFPPRFRSAPHWASLPVCPGVSRHLGGQGEQGPAGRLLEPSGPAK